MMIGNGLHRDFPTDVAPHFRAKIRRMVVRVTVLVTIIAVTTCVGAHLLLDELGLLPYPLNPAMLIGSAIGGVLAASISSVCMSYSARAYYHIENAREDFERLSRTDVLTGLLNRRAFVQTFVDTPAVSALALFDIDHFKKINDSFGHGGGDVALVEMGRVLAARFTAPDTAARIGGEEFAVLIASCAGKDATMLVERVRREISTQTIAFDGHAFSFNVSGGIVHADAGDGIDALLLAADRALYLAKTQGRNRLIDADRTAVLRSPPVQRAPAEADAGGQLERHA